MSAAIFKRHELAQNQVTVERFVASALLLVSVVGSLLYGGGGVSAWRQLAPGWLGASAALALQGLCTWGQWTYADLRWRSAWWLLAFVLSLAMTVAGYWPLVHPWLVGLLRVCEVPETTAPAIAGGLIAFVAGVLDYLPEQILTE